MYISSADFMTRNTERRVEIACPILDRDIRKRIHEYMDVCLADNVKARQLMSNGRYHKIAVSPEDELISSQDVLMETAVGSAYEIKHSVPEKPAVVFHGKTKNKKKKNKAMK